MSFPPVPGWGQRLEAAVLAKGGVPLVAAGASVSESTIKRYMAAENEPGAFKLAAITRFCGVSVEQILFGVHPDLAVTLGATQPNVDDGGAEDVASIPLLDVIASAGPGIENPFPLEIDHLPFPRRWLDELGLPERFARFLGARGDSMEPTIRDGAICLADTRFHVPRIDGIYAVIDGNDVRIKRIARGWENRITLISDNEDHYDPETLSAPASEALRVAGKIVWAGGKI